MGGNRHEWGEIRISPTIRRERDLPEGFLNVMSMGKNRSNQLCYLPSYPSQGQLCAFAKFPLHDYGWLYGEGYPYRVTPCVTSGKWTSDVGSQSHSMTVVNGND